MVALQSSQDNSNFNINRYWINDIARHQRGVVRNGLSNLLAQQGMERDALMTSLAIDPFVLSPCERDFLKLPKRQSSSIYFLLDTHNGIILYIGETRKSLKSRWSHHHCSQFISPYIALGYAEESSIALSWVSKIPVQRRVECEKHLIRLWQPPFNAENWMRWIPKIMLCVAAPNIRC
jgi:hypothetical protein